MAGIYSSARLKKPFGIFLVGNVVGSVYFVAAISPNHNGMPMWTSGIKLSFLERQVLSSRDLTSHPVWDFLYGGLNYQIEHHLFPTIPRVNLKHAPGYYPAILRGARPIVYYLRPVNRVLGGVFRIAQGR